MCEVLDFLNAHPTSDDILAAVYEVKPKHVKPKVKFSKEFDDESYSDLNRLPHWGMVPESIPDDFRESVKFAEELKARITKGDHEKAN